MLERITDKLTDVVRQISGKAHISERNIQDAISEIKLALLEADVSLRVVRRFVNSTAEEALGEKVLRAVAPAQQFVKIIHDKLVQLLGEGHQDLKLKGPDTVSVILLLGLQGSGKTTTAAKLALRLKKTGRKPLLVAADLVRPAAVEQLAILAEQAGVAIYKENNRNPAAVAKNALIFASRQAYDTVVVDTSGRLQIDAQMMDEIEAVKKAARPDELLLVADAMTGQSAVDIAKAFDERLGLTGVILSKFDSDARGGAALSIKSVTGKPIRFVGVGEQLEGLEPFHPERVASRILGMGDVVTLVEKAQAAIDLREAEELEDKLARKTFTLQDYLDQFRRVRKMGSIESLLEMIPGARGAVDPAALDSGELKREEAIILSMTRAERANHRIVGPSRKKRIAGGSGTAVYDVNKLIRKFEKTRLLMRKMTRNKKAQSALLSQLTTKA